MTEHKNELPIGYTSFIDLYKDAVKNFETIGVVFKGKMIIRTVRPEHTYECTHDFIVSQVLIEVLKLKKFSVSQDIAEEVIDDKILIPILKEELKTSFLDKIRSIKNDIEVKQSLSTKYNGYYTLSISAYL